MQKFLIGGTIALLWIAGISADANLTGCMWAAIGSASLLFACSLMIYLDDQPKFQDIDARSRARRKDYE